MLIKGKGLQLGSVILKLNRISCQLAWQNIST